MAELRPIAVDAKSAAKMLQLSTKEFLRLVSAGALPGPSRIGPYPRWAVSTLEAIVSGQAARPSQMDFE